jgi:hypothetical protein
VGAKKDFRLVFGQSVLALYLQGLVFILRCGIVNATMALPADAAGEHLKLKEQSIRTCIRIWDMFRVIIAATAIVNLRLLVRTPEQAEMFARIGLVFGLIIGALATVCFLRLMSRLSSLYRDLKRATGQVYVARPADRAHWYAGGPGLSQPTGSRCLRRNSHRVQLHYRLCDQFW